MSFLQLKTLYIELTHACNQQCKHCYLNGGLHNTVAEMSTEQIKNIFREFKKQGGTYLILTGGEPIMRKDIWELLDYAEELELSFSFASNSLAMTRERLEKLATYKHLALYFTSLLGGDKEKHRYITEKDSYDKVFEALRFFSEKKIPTYVQVTLAKEYIDDMEQIAESLMSFENCFVKFTPIGTLGVQEQSATLEQKALVLPEEEFEYFHKRASLLREKYSDRIEACNIQNYEEISSGMKDYQEEELYSLNYGFVAVRPNGDLSFSCNMENPYVFGKAYESLQIPIDEKLSEYVDVLREAERATLADAKSGILELDVTVDKYIKAFYEKKYA